VAMLKWIIRSVVKHYGYEFLKREYLADKRGSEYATISIVKEDSERKILFSYLADEITRTHLLSGKNVKDIIKSCQNILDEMHA
jgi:hypothetical protein